MYLFLWDNTGREQIHLWKKWVFVLMM